MMATSSRFAVTSMGVARSADVSSSSAVGPGACICAYERVRVREVLVHGDEAPVIGAPPQ